MKKLFLLLALPILAFLSCNNDVEVPDTRTNHLESIGIAHNEMLDLLRQNTKGGMSISEQYHAIIAELDLQEAPPFTEQEIINYMNQYNGFDISNLDDLYNDGIINSRQKTVMLDTYNILKTENETNAQKREKIVMLENIIIYDDSMDSTEKDPLLTYLSVSKNSLDYWTQNGYNAKAPWWAIVISDAVGAAVGFHYFGWVGAVVFGTLASYSASVSIH